MSGVHHIGGIGDWLRVHADQCPEREALVHGDRRLCYRDLNTRVNRLADALFGLGVRKGDRVAGLLLNSAALIETLFACAKLDAIFVPINYRLGAAEVAFIIDDAAPRVLILHDEFVSLIEPAAAGAWPRLVRVGGDTAPYELNYEAFLADGTDVEAGTIVMPDDPHVMMYTSGTTGRPKGALLTHANARWNAINMFLSQAGLDAGDVVLTVAPMFHIGGLGIHTLPALYKGAKIVVVERFDPTETLALVERERATALFLVPAMWLAVMQLPDLDRFDLSSLRILLSGGAPCPVTVIEFFQRRGLPFVEGFGMTETAPGVCFLNAEDAVRKNGSVGKPVMHVEMRIVDAAGAAVAPGEVGELVLRGPSMFAGYWNRPDATAEAFRTGWFHTGDLARQDEEGFYYIVDRSKDMLITGGENVYPAEVEQVLYRHPKVREVAVIGLLDERWGETPVMVAVPHDGETIDVAEIRAFCDGRLAAFKVPKRVVLIDALPRNAAGKVLKRELRERLASA